MSDGGERPGDPQTAEVVAEIVAEGAAGTNRRRLAMDFTPLRENRDFRLLWAGKGISFFGSQITRVAIPFQIYELTRSSFAVGLVALFELVPLLALSLWGGAVADAVDRRRVLVRTDVLLIVLSLGLAGNALLERPNLPAIYALATLAAAVSCFGRPALDSAIPRLVPPSQYGAAAALNAVQYTLAGIVGPAVGGLLVAAFGVTSVFGIDALTFGVSLACASRLRPIPPSAGARRASLAAIGEGLRYVRTSPPLIGTYAVDMVAMVFGMPTALLPALAIDRFHGGAGTLGLLEAAPAVGALAASVLSGWTARIHRHGVAITVAAIAWGVSIIVFGVTSTLWLALAASVVAGAADMVSGIFRMVMWNTIVPDHLRGRLAGVEIASYTSGPALGNFEAGVVASWRGVSFSVISGGVACVVGVVAVAAMLPGFLRYHSEES